ncbi:MAG: hypothetical protein LBT53_01850 [Puniceicoccales bacterium]|nr:hypothetical protein [Puniceicoccales bacterium]
MLAVVLLLLAYLAGTGHCAIATALCESIHDDDCHSPISPAANTFFSETDGHAGHLPHGGDCLVDTGLSTARNFAETVRVPNANSGSCAVSGDALVFGALAAALKHFGALPPPQITRAGAPRKTHDRLLGLACGWQFATHAAGLARAPNRRR